MIEEIILLSKKQFEEFEKRLNEPPKVKKRLQELLRKPALWERKDV